MRDGVERMKIARMIERARREWYIGWCWDRSKTHINLFFFQFSVLFCEMIKGILELSNLCGRRRAQFQMEILHCISPSQRAAAMFGWLPFLISRVGEIQFKSPHGLSCASDAPSASSNEWTKKVSPSRLIRLGQLSLSCRERKNRFDDLKHGPKASFHLVVFEHRENLSSDASAAISLNLSLLLKVTSKSTKNLWKNNFPRFKILWFSFASVNQRERQEPLDSSRAKTEEITSTWKWVFKRQHNAFDLC